MWTVKQQQAFDTLKEKQISPPTLAYTDYTVRSKLHTDALSTGFCAVLCQQQNGAERVVAYGNRSQ